MILFLMLESMTLSPDQDDWMETEVLPEMTIDIPGVFDTLTGAAGRICTRIKFRYCLE